MSGIQFSDLSNILQGLSFKNVNGDLPILLKNEIQLNITQFSQYRTKLNGEEDHCKVVDVPSLHTSTKDIAGQS